MIETQQLSLRAGSRVLLRGLDWQARAGELWCLLGANGSGKSSLLRALAGLDRTLMARVMIQGQALDKLPAVTLARQRSLMPQDVQDAFDATVIDTVLLGRYPHGHSLYGESAEDVSIARKALVDAGLGDFSERNVLSLSGGERQRAALAMLLAQAASLMLLDEPTSHQDLGHQIQVFELLQRLARAGHCVVAAVHDVNLALRFATHALVLDGKGGAVQGSVDTVVNCETLGNAYGHPVRAITDGTARYFVPV